MLCDSRQARRSGIDSLTIAEISLRLRAFRLDLRLVSKSNAGLPVGFFPLIESHRANKDQQSGIKRSKDVFFAD